MALSVFVGSSAEGLGVARAIQQNLEHEADVELWTQGAFGISESALAALLAAIERSDFAVLYLQADDLLSSRGDEVRIARDNIVFELGLFFGALGTERTAMVIDRTDSPRLPTDLAGITPLTFRPHQDGNLVASLGAVSSQVIDRLRKVGPRPLSADPWYGIDADAIFHESAAYWTFSQAEAAGYWSGRCRQVRRLTALKEKRAHTYNLRRRTDNDMPFTDAPPKVTLTHSERSGHGDITLDPPKHLTGRLSFDFKFDPPLRPGETCTLEYDLTVPIQKPGTLEAAMARPQPAMPVPGGGEYVGRKIDERIEDFFIQVDIPRSLGAHSFGFQANAASVTNDEEQSIIRRSGLFTEEIAEVGGVEMTRLILRRTNPPRGVDYRICWIPPRQDEISDQK